MIETSDMQFEERVVTPREADTPGIRKEAFLMIETEILF